MRTVKLVVIGDSGVGKTALRTQYVSGRFSTAYRATIGADFITKTIPHPSDLSQSLTFQIWDTAGQERFSSLSAAFFRGADAALLLFDVSQPETLRALQRWWTTFCERAPVEDDRITSFPVVFVGNKTDL
ncbi:small GTPase superfamily, partial [Vararia minispora EC-137]